MVLSWAHTSDARINCTTPGSSFGWHQYGRDDLCISSPWTTLLHTSRRSGKCGPKDFPLAHWTITPSHPISQTNKHSDDNRLAVLAFRSITTPILALFTINKMFSLKFSLKACHQRYVWLGYYSSGTLIKDFTGEDCVGIKKRKCFPHCMPTLMKVTAQLR